MTALRYNVLANLAGKLWAAALPVLLVPLYIRYLGIEAYGLIGFYASLQAVVSLLDMGMGVTLNRELARLSVQDDAHDAMRDLVRSLETVYWLLAFAAATAIILLAPVIATDWLNASALPVPVLRQSVLAMGVAMAMQFPLALYSAGLMGVQRQVRFNVLNIVAATLRGVGAVVILTYVSRTIVAFFVWQILVGLLFTLSSAYLLWRALPASSRTPRFDMSHLKRIWRFSLSVAGISVTAVLLTQTDTMMLSKLLPLEAFGYFTLATAIALGLYTITSSFYTGVFPRFSQLVALGREEELRGLYHRVSQLLSVTLLPVAITLAAFAPTVLRVWTDDPEIVANAHNVLTILLVGTMINGLVSIPAALQLAHGWTKLGLYQNAIAVLFLIPLVYWSATRYGAVGAAGAWVVLNLGYIFIGVQVMHRRLLKGEKLRWYLQDVMAPLITATAVASLARSVLPEPGTRLEGAALLAGVLFGTFASCAVSMPYPRSLVLSQLGRWRLRLAVGR